MKRRGDQHPRSDVSRSRYCVRDESAETIPDADAVCSFVRERLANYKVPKEIIVLDELPLLPIGKVDKKALKARHTP